MPLSAFAELVVDQVATHCASNANLIVTSFDADALVEVRRQRSDIATGLLFWRGSADAAITRAVDDGHLAIAPSIALLNERTVEKAVAADLAVMTWTVNEPADVKLAASLGIAMIIGDDPRVIAANL